MSCYLLENTKFSRLWLITVSKTLRSVGRVMFSDFFFVLIGAHKRYTQNAFSTSCKVSRYFCSTANTVQTDQQILVKFGDELSDMARLLGAVSQRKKA